MATDEQRIVDHRFRRSLNGRVKEAVRADPDLNRRYWRTLKRKLWIGVMASPFVLVACAALYSLVRFFVLERGKLFVVHYFSANAIGLFASLTVLALSWKVLCGSEVMGTMPRLPVSDGAIYNRAWRRFSRLMFTVPLIIWLLIYLQLAWYPRNLGVVWIWVLICASVQAFLCLGLGSVLTSLNYRFGARLASFHWLWCLGILWAIYLILGGQGAEVQREPFLLELNAMLPTHRVTEVFAAFVGGQVGDFYPLIWLGVAGATLYFLGGFLHQ